MKQSAVNKLSGETDKLMGIVMKTKNPQNAESKLLFLEIADLLLETGKKDQAYDIYKKLFENHGRDDKQIQGKYLSFLAG